MLSKRERILETLRAGHADRVPLLGGWVLGDRQHQALAGCSEQEYWRDPLRWAIEAHRALDVDGMIAVNVPSEPGDYRGGLTKQQFESYKDRYHGPEDVLAFAERLPSAQRALADFDAAGWRAEFRARILDMQGRLGEMLYLPTLWEVVHPRFEWYWEFGYENYLLFMHLYPEAASRLFESEAGVCRRKAEIFVELQRELDLAPLTLVGTDICGGGGPLVAPELLRRVYFPHVRYALEPLRLAGIRAIWHSDGDFRLIVDDILDWGVAGFQGFQEEYGVDIGALAERRTRDGERLTLFAGPSVTTTLPFGTPGAVRRDVERIIDTLAGQCSLFMLPANNILPDCPVDNIVAMYGHARAYSARHISSGGGSVIHETR